jgi:hypothetical protein
VRWARGQFAAAAERAPTVPLYTHANEGTMV